MYSLVLSVGSLCLAGLISAASTQTPQSSQLTRDRREENSYSFVEDVPSNYECQTLPNCVNAIATVQPSEQSILDYVFSPVTAIVSIGSTALSAAKWIFLNSTLVLLGMGIVVGFCTLTSWCSIIIENPSFFVNNYVSRLPYIDNLEYYVSEAYNKYHEMQNGVYEF